MNYFRTSLLAATASIALATAAQATPIAGGSLISFSDGINWNSTSVTFLNGGIASIPASTASGSFAAAFGAGCTSCSQFTDFTYSPFVGPITVYTATLGGVTTTFDLTAVTMASINPFGFLDVLGSGTLTLTGYDPTPGTFFLSTQGPQGMNVSFSATSIASAVPEPASMAIVGAGLFGLGFLRRRKARDTRA